MQKSKVGLDFNEVEHARSVARNIAGQVQDFVEDYTTVAVERTLCRFLGIDNVDENEVPMPNVVVDHLRSNGVLGEDVMFYVGNAMVETAANPHLYGANANGGMNPTVPYYLKWTRIVGGKNGFTDLVNFAKGSEDEKEEVMRDFVLTTKCLSFWKKNKTRAVIPVRVA